MEAFMTYVGKDHVAQYGAFQEIDVHDRFKVVLGEVFGIQRVFPFVNADVDDDFIINLFIHFCRMKYQTGYYYISDPIFYQFVLEQINTPWHAEQFLFDKLQLQFQKPINYKIPSKITKLTQKEINEIGEPDYIEEEEEREREYPNSEEKAVLIEEKKIKGLAALKEEHEELIDLLNN